MPMEIVTIGGSLAGLMCSIALRRLGHHVRIYERAPTPLLHDQGAGIVAAGDFPVFMQQYDKTRSEIAVTSQQRLYLDKSGSVNQRENKQQHMTSWDLLYHILRANFDGLQSDYIKNNTDKLQPDASEGIVGYEHGRQVTRLLQEGERVRVSFESTISGDKNDEQYEEFADFVIVADGASSNTRKLLSPSSKERTYAGYVAFRGTVPETDLSSDARSTFVEKFPLFHDEQVQILAYTIPGRVGDMRQEHRLVNWVWYVNIEWDSERYKGTMTDKDGEKHVWTLPTGGNMRNDVWQMQKEQARAQLPPQFAQLVTQTKSPFVQAVTDLETPADGKCWFLGGKAILVGDALSGFRPHTAASTAQAAFHATLLSKVLSGEKSKDTYEEEVIEHATSMQQHGVFLGNRSQFGDHPLRQ